MSSESESDSATARSPQNTFYEKCFYIYSGLFALTGAFLTNSDFITFILCTEGEGDAVVVVVVVAVAAVVAVVVVSSSSSSY